MNTSLFLRDVGLKVREARKNAGITQKQLAARAGVSERLVRSVENGEDHNVSLGKLASILGELGLDLRVGNDGPAAAPVTQDPSYSELLKQAVASWSHEE